MFKKRLLLYYISPILWYFSVTIGVPLINNFFSGYDSNFVEHALSITVVSTIITGVLFVLFGRKQQNNDFLFDPNDKY
jgi:hypothetical protein